MCVWHKDTIKYLLLIKIATVEACFKQRIIVFFPSLSLLPKEIIKVKSNTKTCSSCNSGMVLRKVTKGKNAGKEFWGCSGFPKCRNVIEIS
tara:strand:+ start:349 stop:621 length:273 start_codon:yes stop_codon:yes gene_type:complete